MGSKIALLRRTVLRRRTVRALTLAALLAGLSGCVGPPGGVATATLRRTVPPTEAFMTPPPGGPGIVAVAQNRYENALEQEIVLQNRSGLAGQNALYVRAFGPMGPDRGVGRLQIDAPDVAAIQREMVARFPGVRMEVSGLYAQNRYGPFGYATGRAGDADCVYAWQRIAAEARVFTFRRGAITWRLRLCERGASARELLLIAYGLTINGYFLSKTWNPYGDPPPLDARIGVPGEAILPQQVVDPTVVAPTSFGGAEPAPAQRRQVRRRRQVAAAARPPAAAPQPAPVLNAPVPGAAIVPRPEETDLTEPLVEGSNLPRLAPRPPRTIDLQVPDRPEGDVPLPLPSVPSPSP